MSDRSTRLTDREAQALWQRAVELQLARESDEDRPRIGPGDDSTSDGLSLEEVLDAARGAGIDVNSVRLAMAERRLPEADELRPDRPTTRWARLLVRAPEAIEVSSSIRAAPERVIAAFQELVARPAFQMVAEDRIGPNPPLDGVLTYRIDKSSSISSSFHGNLALADVRVVLVTARLAHDGTVLHLRAPKFEHGVNLALATGISGGLGAGGAYGGAAAGSALAGTLGASLAVAAAPIAAGVAAGAAIGIAGCRGIGRWGHRKGEAAMRQLLQAVALEAEARGDAT